MSRTARKKDKNRPHHIMSRSIPELNLFNHDEDKEHLYNWMSVTFFELLQALGSDISFDEDTWVCDKRRRNNSDPYHHMNIYFATIPDEYKSMVKYYSIIRLLQGDTVRTVRSSIVNIVRFTCFLKENYSAPLLSACNISIAVRFKEDLDVSNLADSTKKISGLRQTHY